MKLNLIKIFLIVFFTVSFISCENDEECRKDKYVIFKTGFYHTTYNASTKTYASTSLAIDSIWVQGLGNDSVIYKNKKSVSTINLPLNKFSNQTDFAIRFNNTTDTLTILHQDTIQYLSLECGCIKTFVLDTVISTTHFIDSIKISNHNVNTTDAEQIKIYH